MNPQGLSRESGIYLLKHQVTGDTYVGRTDNIRHRVTTHRANLRHRRHRCAAMQRVADAHGILFDVQVLEFGPVESLDAAETAWILKLKPTLNTRLPESLRPAKVPTKMLAIDVDDDLLFRLKMASALFHRSIKSIVQESINDWLTAHGYTPEMLQKLGSSHPARRISNLHLSDISDMLRWSINKELR